MFTMIPLDVEGEEVVGLSKRFYLIVLVGAFYGLIAGSLMWALSQVFTTLTAGVLALLVVHALNRFLHFDGLSDFGDGMICSGDQEKKMRAVKDSHTGAGGIGYSIVFTALSIVALGQLSPQLVFFGPFVAELLNKNAMVFAASAYGAGGGLVKLSNDGDTGVKAEELYFSKKMQNHHGGMILADGCLYGANGGNEGGSLVCLEFQTGKVLWDSREGSDRRAPKGSLAMADGRLYYRTEKGTVLLRCQPIQLAER